jgi:hypothetical protein
LSIIAKFYPNGEFSQGVDTSRKRRDNQHRDKQRRDKVSLQQQRTYLQWCADNAEMLASIRDGRPPTKFSTANGRQYTLVSSDARETVLRWQDETGYSYDTRILSCLPKVIYEWQLNPLVYQVVEFCEKPASRKKLDSMTKNMARNIRNAVYMLERRPGGKDCLSFLTLTLPDLSTNGLNLCCQNWDAMVKKFFDWLRERLKRYNMPLEHVYCTEIQNKRLEQRHEYAPHLHVVFKGRHGKKTPWLITPKQIRKAWKRCISGIVNEHFNDSALENLQRIKYSAARYLSKYLSKGCKPDASMSKAGHIVLLRTQWGGMARTLSRDVRRFTRRLSSDGGFREPLIFIISNMGLLLEKGIVKYYRQGFVPLSSDKDTGAEYGLHVLAGCLSQPTCEGGLTRLLEFCKLQLIS